ncbi:MAG: hypothetical protein K2G88_05845, partial [Oscillospiraceae bacterium]|nr:hypothetical protein [Oscillospiraceae bacterium]
FVGLGLLFLYSNILEKSEQTRKKNLHCTLCKIIIFLWFILTGSNRITAITIFALPVIASIFCERWLDRTTKIKSAKNFNALLLIIITGSGTYIGYLLTNLLAGDISADYEEAYSEYSAMNTWAEHLQEFPVAWFSLLGANMQEDDPLMSINSVQSLLIIITSIILLILPVIALCYYSKIQDRKLKILILTYWFMSLLIMTGYIMGRLYVANWRLSPIVAMSVVVSIAFIRWAVSQINLKRLMTLCMIPVFIVCVTNAVTIAGMSENNTSENILYQLAEELENLDLTYGYASFWQANGLTVVSDSKIQCRDVYIDEAGCRIRNYQSNIHWYESQPEQKNYFLLMTKSEEQILINSNHYLTERQHGIANLPSGYVVWIYSENLF